MSAPIYNPAVPFVKPFQASPGTLIRIEGTPHINANCFAVNLQCGPNLAPRDDIALHLSPVFTSPPRIVRNSLEGQRWGPEESHGSPFPVERAATFELVILIESSCYKIAFNGSHFAEFSHRIPLHRVNTLAIDGEVALQMVIIEQSTTAASAPPLSAAGDRPIGFATAPLTNAPSPMYPMGGAPGMPPYPVHSDGMPMPGAYPPAGYGGGSGYPQTQPPGYPQPPAPAYPLAQGYVPQATPGYPGYGGAPPQPNYGYPTQQPYPGGGYPGHPPQGGASSSGGGFGLGSVLGTGGAALAGAALLKSGMGKKAAKAGLVGAAAKHVMGGGHHKKAHKSSMPMNIPGGLGTGLAAGAGALAAGAMLSHVNPFKPKKMKKMFKHKHSGWRGSSSSSSSSSSEEE